MLVVSCWVVLAHALRNLLKVVRDTDLIEVEFDSTGVWRPVSSECSHQNTLLYTLCMCVYTLMNGAYCTCITCTVTLNNPGPTNNTCAVRSNFLPRVGVA